jgi:hypothetical protein
MFINLLQNTSSTEIFSVKDRKYLLKALIAAESFISVLLFTDAI